MLISHAVCIETNFTITKQTCEINICPHTLSLEKSGFFMLLEMFDCFRRYEHIQAYIIV